MKNLSVLIVPILVFGLLFTALPNESEAGIGMPGIPRCCDNINICIDDGGLGFPLLCPPGSEIIEGALCDSNDQCSPVSSPFPTIEPLTRNVPTLSAWGFMSLGVGLAVIALAAILLRRKKATN